MKKKWTRILAAAACTLCVLAALQLLAGAEGACSLQVWPCAVDKTENVEMYKELMAPGPDGEAPRLGCDVYKVAGMARSQTADTYDFTAEPAFPDITIPEVVESGAVWASIAQEAAGAIFLDEAGRVREELSIRPLYSDVPMGEELTGLEPGLYLIVAHERGQSHQEYLDTGKTGHLVTRFQGARNQYTFSPELITLPTKEAADGEANTADPTPWIENVTVYLKPGMNDALGPIRIEKTLLSYGSDGPVTFVFQVRARIDGELVYDKVVSLDFTEAGTKDLLLEDLPVGAVVEVVEVYSGAGCIFVSQENPEDPTVKLEYPIEFRFVNDFDNTARGHGILNRFVYVDGEWQVNPAAAPEGGEAP